MGTVRAPRTLSLHLILFSASLTASQNFNPVNSEMLFSQCFYCRPLLLFLALFLVKLSWQALLNLIDIPTTLTCISLPWLRCHHRARSMACLILSLTASLVMWSLYDMPSSFPKHLISVACNFFRMSAVNV